MELLKHGPRWATIMILGLGSAFASEPSWEEGTRILVPRSNPYLLSEQEFLYNRKQGYQHALQYPVEVTGLWMPWRPLQVLFDEPNSLWSRLMHPFLRSTDFLWDWVGLHRNPESPAKSVRMGVTLRRLSLGRSEATEVMTLSCAVCHSSSLFGRVVLGMTNRFPRGNAFLMLGKEATRWAGPDALKRATHASEAEVAWYDRLRKNTRAVGGVLPTVLGLDTSLAQVALSLSRRNPDAWATKNPDLERRPAKDYLESHVADSKPAVWWNVKYKNRWLSDGSVVSGNPILTNFLWNELGRGTDLKSFSQWVDENQPVIQQLTTAVFSTEAPRITEFFPAERMDLNRAKEGQKIFVQICARCHGRYEKGWDQPGAQWLPLAEQLRTTQVFYHASTPVIDVGTDPMRREGMQSLEERLNALEFSKRNGIVVRKQKGYVPPPLVGIWARFPYFHNNSAPSLCAVLTPAPQRPVTYWAGPVVSTVTDYDWECSGYPTGDQVPETWKRNWEWFFNTKKSGLAASGHDEGIFLKDGQEILSAAQKRSLIEYLKTL